MAQHLAPGSQPDAAMFNAMLRLMFDYGITMPAEWSTFFRALIVLEGTLTTIAPGLLGDRRRREHRRRSGCAARSTRARCSRRCATRSCARSRCSGASRATSTARSRMPRARRPARAGHATSPTSTTSAFVTKLVNRLVLAFLSGAIGLALGRPHRDRRRAGVLRQHLALPGVRLLRPLLRDRAGDAGHRRRAPRSTGADARRRPGSPGPAAARVGAATPDRSRRR